MYNSSTGCAQQFISDIPDTYGLCDEVKQMSQCLLVSSLIRKSEVTEDVNETATFSLYNIPNPHLHTISITHFRAVTNGRTSHFASLESLQKT